MDNTKHNDTLTVYLVINIILLCEHLNELQSLFTKAFGMSDNHKVIGHELFSAKMCPVKINLARLKHNLADYPVHTLIISYRIQIKDALHISKSYLPQDE